METFKPGTCQPLQGMTTTNENGDHDQKSIENKSAFDVVETKNSCTFSSLVSVHLNSLGMIWYGNDGQLQEDLPLNISPDVTSPTSALALDCEFVDIGKAGEREFTLARIAVVNEFGFVLYHAFVKPTAPVQDYVTEISGVRKQDLEGGAPLEEVRQIVSRIVERKILVGHSIDSDLKSLNLKFPKNIIRDTAIFFCKIYKRTPSLKYLVKEELGVEIQIGEHQPVEDAQASMKLYLKYRAIWENLNKLGQCHLTPGKRLLPTYSPY